jgi:hypothetical protein
MWVRFAATSATRNVNESCVRTRGISAMVFDGNLAGPQSSHISEKDTKVKRTNIASSFRIARIGTLRRQN